MNSASMKYAQQIMYTSEQVWQQASAQLQQSQGYNTKYTWMQITRQFASKFKWWSTTTQRAQMQTWSKPRPKTKHNQCEHMNHKRDQKAHNWSLYTWYKEHKARTKVWNKCNLDWNKQRLQQKQNRATMHNWHKQEKYNHHDQREAE